MQSLSGARIAIGLSTAVLAVIMGGGAVSAQSEAPAPHRELRRVAGCGDERAGVRRPGIQRRAGGCRHRGRDHRAHGRAGDDQPRCHSLADAI